MPVRAKLFILLLFAASLIIAILTGPDYFTIPKGTYFKALALYFCFSALYAHLKIIVKKGKTTIDYGVSYDLSIGLFAGPLGLFLFEVISRFTTYFNRKFTNSADPDEFLHTFYNIGSFALNHSIAFFLFIQLEPYFSEVPFGFWILISLLVCVVALLSDTYLIILFFMLGDMKTRGDAFNFLKSRSILDMGKLIFSNGLLYIFLLSEEWEMLIALFLLNYLVSRSFFEKSESIQHKIERDKFKQMAYTDFLTEVYNRAFMDKKMDELNQSGEAIGIVVADIDSFKQINDTYNHAVGDRVIQHFAATVQGYLQGDDYLFRSGGEEFTIFLRNRDYLECVKLVEKIQAGVARTPAATEYNSQPLQIPVTASFGLYYYRTSDTIDIKKAYIYADNLLLHSKELGKNIVSSKNGMNDSSFKL